MASENSSLKIVGGPTATALKDSFLAGNTVRFILSSTEGFTKTVEMEITSLQYECGANTSYNFIGKVGPSFVSGHYNSRNRMGVLNVGGFTSPFPAKEAIRNGPPGTRLRESFSRHNSGAETYVMFEVVGATEKHCYSGTIDTMSIVKVDIGSDIVLFSGYFKDENGNSRRLKGIYESTSRKGWLQ